MKCSMMRACRDTLPVFTRIAIFYQDDSFGRDGLSGVKRALARRGLELAAEGTFERNTRAVAPAASQPRRWNKPDCNRRARACCAPSTMSAASTSAAAPSPSACA
jgi:hypothetical protein